MSDYERIYLQPECCASEYEGRLWCEDKDPVECDDGVEWTEYVRADLFESLQTERDGLVAQLAEAREAETKIINIAYGYIPRAEIYDFEQELKSIGRITKPE